MVQILKLLVQIGTNYGTINGADKTMIFKYCGARTYLEKLTSLYNAWWMRDLFKNQLVPVIPIHN